jgi:hypothetical protein
MTNDYGATWTRLTDGKNGIPADWPTRVVREDPVQSGLLYAGAEFGAFVSFDNGKHWQTLQQNLPATPVTDIKVHRNDLVVSTMGRAFWIMDNITPLQQIAAGLSGQAHLFQPREAYRMRYAPSGARPDSPEYPPPGAHIDYYFAAAPAEDVRLEILDSSGKTVREFTTRAPRQDAQQGQGMRGPRSGAAAARLTKKAGMNRFVWDLRYAGPEGGGAGPLAVPGRYQAKISSGDWSATRWLEVRIDPRVAADGVTLADLKEQLDISLKVRDAISEARRLSARIREAREKMKGDQAAAKKLQELLGRVVTASVIYPQPMLIDQLSNIARMIGQADQKVGKDAFIRYEDLMKEMAAIKTALDAVAGAAPTKEPR